MQAILRIMIPLFAILAGLPAWAGPAISGSWKVIDDHSGLATAIVDISEHNGQVEGRIARLIPAPGDEPDPRCDLCSGERKGQRITGMLILWGISRQGTEFGDGKILDPEEGTVYRCRIHLSGDGRQLEVRGYVGLPLLGRSQTWLRN